MSGISAGAARICERCVYGYAAQSAAYYSLTAGSHCGGKEDGRVETNVRKMKELIDQTDNIVFFGGAGVSTESGIPDFRSVDGLYHQKYDYPPETILSHTFYRERPEEFFRFYRDKMLYLDAQPNAAHKKLAQWEREGKLKAVITQNIDGLHQKAGCRNVLELH